jgi:hypothetical protein
MITHFFFFFSYPVTTPDLYPLGGDLPHTDLVIGVSGEQGLAIWGPSKRQDVWGLSLWSDGIGLELINNVLGFEIPDLDRWSGSGAQPVSVGAEGKSFNDITRFQGVQVLAFVQVPKHSLAVLTTRGAQGTIRRHSDSVQVSVVANMIELELAVGQGPDLGDTIPTAGHNDRVGGIW